MPDNSTKNPTLEPDSDEELVTVLATSRVADLPVIESLLRAAEIPFLTEGEGMMNLFPSEALGALFKSQAEVRFRVPASRAEEARALLETPPEDLDAQALAAEENESGGTEP